MHYLLVFHYNIVCTNAPQFYFIGTLPGYFVFFQKVPAVYRVLCIPVQMLVITTAEVTGTFFLPDNPQAIFCKVIDERIFF